MSAQRGHLAAERRLEGDPGRTNAEILARENLHLVDRVVREIAVRLPAHVDRDDLLSAAMSGLADATRCYDPARGIPFPAYATRRMRGAILDDLRSLDWMSRSHRAKARRVGTAAESLTTSLGRRPTDTELAQRAGVSVDDMLRLQASAAASRFLNYDTLDRDGEVAQATAGRDNPEEELLDREQTRLLATAISALPHRLQVVVRGQFYEGRRMSEIADQLHITEARAWQLRAKALAVLREAMEIEHDADSPSGGDRPQRRRHGGADRRALSLAG